jgi:hypothetical protein
MEGGEWYGTKRGADGMLQQIGEAPISENSFLLERE